MIRFGLFFKNPSGEELNAFLDGRVYKNLTSAKRSYNKVFSGLNGDPPSLY